MSELKSKARAVLSRLPYVLGAALVVACLAFGASNVWDFGRVAVDELQETLRGEVPISTQISVLDKKVAALSGRVDEAQQTVARQRALVSRHAEQADARSGEILDSRDQLYALQDAYEASGTDEYVSVGEGRHARGAVVRNIETRFERLRRAESALAHDHALLGRERSVLDANERALEALLAAQDRLELLAKDLRVRNELVGARKVESFRSVEGAATQDVTALYEQVDQLLRVEEELVSLRESDGDIPVAEDTAPASALDALRARRAREQAADLR